ncbi:MAG: hypothetical protein Q7S22_01620 [Candidatus Micrarchaeota archaeon]|nr:hypothetical protein [Candidatus Micrarchaeota archaeon]
MKKLAILPFVFLTAFTASAKADIPRQHTFSKPPCIIEGIANAKAISCNEKEGRKIAVAPDKIVVVTNSDSLKKSDLFFDKSAAEIRFEISLAGVIADSGPLLSSSIVGDIIYFITQNGSLYRYSLNDSDFKMMEGQLQISTNTTIKFSKSGGDETVDILDAQGSLVSRVKYIPSIGGFFLVTE